MIVTKNSVVSVVSDEIISYLVLEISLASVVTGEVIFYVLYVVSKVSIVSDGSMTGIQNQSSIEYLRSQRS